MPTRRDVLAYGLSGTAGLLALCNPFSWARSDVSVQTLDSDFQAQIQLDRYIKVQTSGLLSLDEDRFALVAY